MSVHPLPTAGEDDWAQDCLLSLGEARDAEAAVGSRQGTSAPPRPRLRLTEQSDVAGAEPLFPDCPLPGCRNVTEIPSQPCTECRATFGDMLRPCRARGPETAQPPMASSPGICEQAVQAKQIPSGTASESEWRRNQTCWCCELKRACRIDPDSPNGWICKECVAIT